MKVEIEITEEEAEQLFKMAYLKKVCGDLAPDIRAEDMLLCKVLAVLAEKEREAIKQSGRSKS